MAVEESLRNPGRVRRYAHDPDDGQRVDAASRRLDARHQEQLRMVYMWKAGREVSAGTGGRDGMCRVPPFLKSRSLNLRRFFGKGGTVETARAMESEISVYVCRV
jgi:hypothetical protein